MNIKTIIRVAKVGITIITIVPPVVEGTKVIAGLATQALKYGINKSETINNIKKDFKNRKDGVINVKFKEV